MLYFTKHNIKNPTYFFMSNLSNINLGQAKNGSWQEKLKNQLTNNPKIKTAFLLGIGIVIGLASCNFYQKKHPPIVVIHRQPSIFSPFWFHDNYYQVQDEIYEQLKNSQNLPKKSAQSHNFSANLTQKQDDNFHYYTLRDCCIPNLFYFICHFWMIKLFSCANATTRFYLFLA